MSLCVFIHVHSHFQGSPGGLILHLHSIWGCWNHSRKSGGITLLYSSVGLTFLFHFPLYFSISLIQLYRTCCGLKQHLITALHFCWWTSMRSNTQLAPVKSPYTEPLHKPLHKPLHRAPCIRNQGVSLIVFHFGGSKEESISK